MVFVILVLIPRLIGINAEHTNRNTIPIARMFLFRSITSLKQIY
jgi:hypothetical protein